jgi:hypothetical protein
MPRWRDDGPEWGDDRESDLDEFDDEFEADDEDEDEEGDDEEATIACPYCGRSIHEDSQRCPYCENYVSREDSAGRKPWWLIVGVGACLYIVYRWIVPW